MKKVQLAIGCIFLFLCGCKNEEAASSVDTDHPIVTKLQQHISPLTAEQDLDPLLEQIGNSRFVLLGEASHGTAEFYEWRAALTQRLIQERGFSLVAVEGDWPDAYAVNQYVKGTGPSGQARAVLQAFDRWPTWMWANEEIAQLADWMRSYNEGQALPQQVGFYGMDVYSLWESLERIIAALEKSDPQTAQVAREAYQCFAAYQQDEQAYAEATLRGVSCAAQLTRVLETVRAKYPNAATQEDQFDIEQNALVAINAERYYQAMVRSNAGSWNVRDRHMVETVNRLMQLKGFGAKIIIWAHNTHVGDARYTDMAEAGMVNVGQLVREEHGSEGVYVVGFGTYQGEVIAANQWGAPLKRMRVPAAQTGTWEDILHQVSPENKIVLLSGLRGDPQVEQRRGNRAIGVSYNPGNEQGNYVPTVLTQRYDGFVFLDKTQALHPLPTLTQSMNRIEPTQQKGVALIND
jgi:erythromycin esterase-like protein